MNLELLIPILCAVAVMAVGAAFLLYRILRRAPVRARLGIGEPSYAAVGGGSASVMAGGAGGAGAIATTSYGAIEAGGTRFNDMLDEIGRRVGGEKTSNTLAEQLVQAGYHDRRAAAVYLGAKTVLMLAGVCGVGLLVLPLNISPAMKLVTVLWVTGVLYFIPNVIVARHRSRRRSEVRTHLPDAIDLLEICASAGMGLDMAWNSVADEVRAVSPILADEMALTNLEIHLGAPRVQAMRNMGKRTGAEELYSLVAVLVQSERFGTSIVDALRTYANSMRETRSMHSQELAEKMAVKLLFPMILFIFPSVILVMIGPAGMTLYKVFST
jgi:tight adherence protein C